MPDIQMCTGRHINEETRDEEWCGVMMKCYRRMACPSQFQAWGDAGERFTIDDGCEMYVPMGSR